MPTEIVFTKVIELDVIQVEKLIRAAVGGESGRIDWVVDADREVEGVRIVDTVSKEA